MFVLLWPNGWETNNGFIPADGDGDLATNHEPSPKHKHPWQVECLKCHKKFYSSKKTHYYNAVRHVVSCVGKEELLSKVEAALEFEKK